MNTSVPFFALCALVLAVSQVNGGLLSDEQKAKIMEIGKSCMEESGISMDLVLKLKKGEYVDDPKVKEQLFCFSKKVGFQNEAGEMQMENIKKHLMELNKDEARTKEIMDKCLVKKATPQETVFEVSKCMHSFAPDEQFD